MKKILLVIYWGCFVISIPTNTMLSRLSRVKVSSISPSTSSKRTFIAPPFVLSSSFKHYEDRPFEDKMKWIAADLEAIKNNKNALRVLNDEIQKSWFKRTFSNVNIASEMLRQTDQEKMILEKKVSLLEEQLKEKDALLLKKTSFGIEKE